MSYTSGDSSASKNSCALNTSTVFASWRSAVLSSAVVRRIQTVTLNSRTSRVHTNWDYRPRPLFTNWQQLVIKVLVWFLSNYCVVVKAFWVVRRSACTRSDGGLSAFFRRPQGCSSRLPQPQLAIIKV